MIENQLDVAVIGGGVGGVTAALTLRQKGIEATVYEQAERFGRVGAAINLTPNSVTVLDGVGVGHELRELSCRPASRVNRAWDTGAVVSSFELAEHAEARYGAPLLVLHRAELLSLLESRLDDGQVRFGKRLIGLAEHGDRVEARFADGTSVEHDVVIAADGIHSAARASLFPDEETPRFTGIVAFRSIFDADRAPSADLTSLTKWWGPRPESEIVTFPISHGKELFVFATVAQDGWTQESWTSSADPAELSASFADFAAEARELIAGCDVVLKTALYDRTPLRHWVSGRVALLGDACHPMTPFMAQGAAMSLEDVAVITRCLSGAETTEVPDALRTYEQTRLGRASRIQLSSHNNKWQGTAVDADWVYGYDAWTTPLGPSAE